jgi:hypothetical protein
MMERIIADLRYVWNFNLGEMYLHEDVLFGNEESNRSDAKPNRHWEVWAECPFDCEIVAVAIPENA